MSNADDFVNFYDNTDETSDDTAPEVVEDTPEASSEDDSSEDNEVVETEKEDVITEKADDDDLPSESKGLLAKAQDEKRKRQDLEKQLDDMKAQIEKLSQSKQEAETPEIDEPDVLDEGYTPHIKSLINNEVVKVKVELSRDNAIDKWGDEFIEAEKFFMSNASENDLADALKSHNPAKYVFNIVKKHKEQQKIQDPDYVKNLEAELRAKILKEMETEKPTKLSSKSILGKGSVNIKESTESIDPLDYYDKQSIF